MSKYVRVRLTPSLAIDDRGDFRGKRKAKKKTSKVPKREDHALTENAVVLIVDTESVRDQNHLVQALELVTRDLGYFKA